MDLDTAPHSVLCTKGLTTPGPSVLLGYLQPPSMGSTTPTYTTGARRNICMSWNKGVCIFPANCLYRYVCVTCQQLHKARDCPERPIPRPTKAATSPNPAAPSQIQQSGTIGTRLVAEFSDTSLGNFVVVICLCIVTDQLLISLTKYISGISTRYHNYYIY